MVGGLEIGGVAVLPDPRNSDSGLIFEQNDASGVIPNARFGNDVHDPTQRTGS